MSTSLPYLILVPMDIEFHLEAAMQVPQALVHMIGLNFLLDLTVCVPSTLDTGDVLT